MCYVFMRIGSIAWRGDCFVVLSFFGFFVGSRDGVQ